MEAEQTKALTGFYTDPEKYLIEGKEVSKERFILESGMDFLLDGASTVHCSQCKRKAAPFMWHELCNMNGCHGVFY